MTDQEMVDERQARGFAAYVAYMAAILERPLAEPEAAWAALDARERAGFCLAADVIYQSAPAAKYREARRLELESMVQWAEYRRGEYPARALDDMLYEMGRRVARLRAATHAEGGGD